MHRHHVAVAYVNLGQSNKVVAMGIASLKATLVVLYFMHVKYASRMTKLIVISGLFFLGILLCLTMVDYGSRDLGQSAGHPAVGTKGKTKCVARLVTQFGDFLLTSNTVDGSTRTARMARSRHPSSVISTTSDTAPTKSAGSEGLTPARTAWSARPTAKASTTPTTRQGRPGTRHGA